MVEREDSLVIAVADGHGSPRCPRAATGAAFATEAAVEALTTPVTEQQLPAALVAGWRRRVDDDVERRPPSRDEQELVDGNPPMLYGTTLLAARVTQGELVLVQIGDGDVLLGDRERPRTAARPMADGSPRALTVTHSLSGLDAADRIDVHRVDLRTTAVDVVMLCTDGLDFAYEDPAWHDPTMADLLDRLAALDPSLLTDELHRWCEPPARVGGDDTTIAIAVRADLLTGP